MPYMGPGRAPAPKARQDRVKLRLRKRDVYVHFQRHPFRVTSVHLPGDYLEITDRLSEHERTELQRQLINRVGAP
jgi:hypothetical protein